MDVTDDGVDVAGSAPTAAGAGGGGNGNIVRRSKPDEADRTYICDVCRRGYRRPGDLKRHQVVHDPNRKLPTSSSGVGLVPTIVVDQAATQATPVDVAKVTVDSQSQQAVKNKPLPRICQFDTAFKVRKWRQRPLTLMTIRGQFGVSLWTPETAPELEEVAREEYVPDETEAEAEAEAEADFAAESAAQPPPPPATGTTPAPSGQVSGRTSAMPASDGQNQHSQQQQSQSSQQRSSSNRRPSQQQQHQQQGGGQGQQGPRQQPGAPDALPQWLAPDSPLGGINEQLKKFVPPLSVHGKVLQPIFIAFAVIGLMFLGWRGLALAVGVWLIAG
eukprot:m.182516 g.182516  ORF g.182516 m.182516 type:complete len:331 (-) comp17460_c5_seq5:1733-2725(-)